MLDIKNLPPLWEINEMMQFFVVAQGSSPSAKVGDATSLANIQEDTTLEVISEYEQNITKFVIGTNWHLC